MRFPLLAWCKSVGLIGEDVAGGSMSDTAEEGAGALTGRECLRIAMGAFSVTSFPTKRW